MMLERDSIVRQLMNFSECEIPLFFLRFEAADTPAIEIINNKKEYIYRQINLLKDFELELLNDDINKIQNNRKQFSDLDLDACSSIKPPKIFISHSSLDSFYIKQLVLLFEQMGIKSESLFCTSDSTYGVPLEEDIYGYLKKQFSNFNLHVIFVLSKNYYSSPAALNEMGAAWILQNRKTVILLPGFDYSDIKGVVNTNTINIKLDEDERTLKDRLSQFYESIILEFGLQKLTSSKWEQYRDDFIGRVNQGK